MKPGNGKESKFFSGFFQRVRFVFFCWLTDTHIMLYNSKTKTLKNAEFVACSISMKHHLFHFKTTTTKKSITLQTAYQNKQMVTSPAANARHQTPRRASEPFRAAERRGLGPKNRARTGNGTSQHVCTSKAPPLSVARACNGTIAATTSTTTTTTNRGHDSSSFVTEFSIFFSSRPESKRQTRTLAADGRHGYGFIPSQPASGVGTASPKPAARTPFAFAFFVVVVVGQDTRALLEGDFIGRCEFYNRRFTAENRQCVCLRVFNGQSVG